MCRLSFSFFAFLVAAVAQAASIDVGNHLLLPNTAGQKIAIYVTGGDPIVSVDLLVQICDGGPELTNFSMPAGTDAPGVQSTR